MKLFSFSLLFLLFLLANTDFLPNRLAIVAKANRNFIVRGNLPISNEKFQFQELKGNLSELTGLNQFNLVVISFLNFLTAKETRNRYIQEKYFESHPEKGHYSTKLILGSLVDSSSLPNWLRRIYAVGYEQLGLDDLSDFVEQLNGYLRSKEPTVVYIHCSAGVDRTGYVAAAYKMKFQNKSFQEVVQENLQILKGVRKYMHFNTYNGLKWFCLSLGREHKQCLEPISK